MGDVVSSHLDENRRQMIKARTSEVFLHFSFIFHQQFPVALFNSVRCEIEGVGKQSQLLHRKDALADRCIFSGSLFQYLEENRKWRNRFVSVPNDYTINLYQSQTTFERQLNPKVTINSAGYKVLTSLDQYMELLESSLPGLKAKASSGSFIKCASHFLLILWHPYARHHYFCVTTEKEHIKWNAVLQDCVRHCNHGLSEDCPVQTPAFTEAIRLHRQVKGHYGTWDMMCGQPAQILANLVMEGLQPELRNVIAPRLKGKAQQRHRKWMLICDAVYRQVLSQTKEQYDALAAACDAQRAQLDATLRTDMDQIITAKEHVSSKIQVLVLPQVEQLLRSSVQAYISSILDALMEPTSRGFAQIRDVFFKELLEINKNLLNGGGKEQLTEDMERVSMLAFHPVKMQSCYEQMEQLNLQGLQQRMEVCDSTSVFISRAQILMREKMDDAVFTFEQLLKQTLENQGEHGEHDLCTTIQNCQERVLKKYDYDSSSVRKKFFREALLQMIIPYMLQQLYPPCSSEFPHFKELIFEDFSRFLLVENLFEEVVLQSVTKEIMMAVREAAVQRRHNLFRDSIVLSNSDPNLHLLAQKATVDWTATFGTDQSDGSTRMRGELEGGGTSGKRRRQVVSMIQLDGLPLPYESCLEVPGVEQIPEEETQEQEAPTDPKSPDSVTEIRDLINPVVELLLPASEEDRLNGAEPTAITVTMADGLEEEVTHMSTVKKSNTTSAQTILHQLTGNMVVEIEKQRQDEANIDNAIQDDANVNNALQDHANINNSIQDDANVNNAIQDDANVNNAIQDDANVDNAIQDDANVDNAIQDDANVDNAIQDDANVDNAIQDDANVDNAIQDDANVNNAIQDEANVDIIQDDTNVNVIQDNAIIDDAIQEVQTAAQDDKGKKVLESDAMTMQFADASVQQDSSFQPTTNAAVEDDEHEPITKSLKGGAAIIDLEDVEVMLA